jgi:hypothetical protein
MLFPFWKSPLLLLVFLALVPEHIYCQLPENKLFIPKDSGISLTVPGGIMKENSSELSTPVGNLLHREYAIDYEDNGKYYAFLFSYVDYPMGAMHEDSLELLKDFFQIAKDESLFLMRGTLVYESLGEWLGHPSYQWRINYKNNRYSIRNKSVLIGSRYFLIRVISSSDLESGEIAQDFINSLRLLD